MDIAAPPEKVIEKLAKSIGSTAVDKAIMETALEEANTRISNLQRELAEAQGRADAAELALIAPKSADPAHNIQIVVPEAAVGVDR